MFLKHILECRIDIVCWKVFLGAENHGGNLAEWQAAKAQPTNSYPEDWSDWSKKAVVVSTRKYKSPLLHKYQVAYTRKCVVLSNPSIKQPQPQHELPKSPNAAFPVESHLWNSLFYRICQIWNSSHIQSQLIHGG